MAVVNLSLANDSAWPAFDVNISSIRRATNTSDAFVWLRQQDSNEINEFLRNISALLSPERHNVLIAMYVVIFTLALLANIFVIIIVVHFNYMRSVTNIFLVNLAIADLLVTIICMPISVTHMITLEWMFGATVCQMSSFLQCVTVSTSIFTITCMSVDRYLAISRVISCSKFIKRRTAVHIIAVIWLWSMCIASPLLFVTQTELIPLPTPRSFDADDNRATNATTVDESLELIARSMTRAGEFVLDDRFVTLAVCRENWTEDLLVQRWMFGCYCFVIVYLVPGIIMVTAYLLMGKTLCSVTPPCDRNEGRTSTRQSNRLMRERKRVAFILLLLALLFAFCWMPYHTISLLKDIGELEEDALHRQELYTLWLGHANSAINPLVYCFMTRNFRKSLKQLVVRWHDTLRCRNRHRNGSMMDSSDFRLNRHAKMTALNRRPATKSSVMITLRKRGGSGREGGANVSDPDTRVVEQRAGNDLCPDLLTPHYKTTAI